MSGTIHRFSWGVSDDAQVWIVHLGSKSTPLIAQALREIGLKSCTFTLETFVAAYAAAGSVVPRLVILSGGDQSVYDEGSPDIPDDLFAAMCERSMVLGICYGAQLMAKKCGGTVVRMDRPEFGVRRLTLDREFYGVARSGDVVMNHRDEISVMPMGWTCAGSTPDCDHAFIHGPCPSGGPRIVAAQFHPEMTHTSVGGHLFMAVAFACAGCKQDFTFHPETFIPEAVVWMRAVRPSGRVISAVSGIDSAAALRIGEAAYGERLIGLFVDTGWCREYDGRDIAQEFLQSVYVVPAAERFHREIEAIPYPVEGTLAEREHSYYDRVRKVIGATFIDVFAQSARLAGYSHALVQGTNAADIIESETGLKAHHNVGGLPEALGCDIIEPVAGLYKNEIRALGRALGLSPRMVHRQPFPGPGLALRSWGKLDRRDADALRRADAILEEEVSRLWPDPSDPSRPSQYYVALAKTMPSTGLMGDDRVVGYALIVRMVDAGPRENYASAPACMLAPDFQKKLVQRLTSEVVHPDGTPIVRVLYEITDKPPSTVEPH